MRFKIAQFVFFLIIIGSLFIISNPRIVNETHPIQKVTEFQIAASQTLLEFTGFSSAPSGWTLYNFQAYGGECISDPTPVDRQLITKGYDLSSYAGARIICYTRAATATEYETGDWKINFSNETGSHLLQTIAGAGPIGWTEYDLNVTSSYSNFKFAIVSGTATYEEQIATDNWAIYGLTPTGEQELLEDWRYRQQINLDEGTGAGVDYTVNVSIYYNETHDNSINLFGHSQTDFDDVRFVDNDQVTMLSYWRESYTVSDSALFWFKVADNLTAANVTFYIYYGNDAVSTTSNGEETFLFFDDFDDASIDPSVWSNSGATETGGTLVLDPNEWVKSVDTFGPAVAIEARMKSTNNRRYNMGFGAAIPFSGSQWIQHNYDGNMYMYEGNSDTGTLTHPSSGVYGIMSLYWTNGTDGAYSLNRATTPIRTDNDIPDTACYAGVNTWGSATGITYTDWLFIRKWVSNEPFITTSNGEEDYQAITSAIAAYTSGVDNFLIIIGFIMVPASTLFLVRGGRSALSSDKVFYSIVIFMIGWALIIGGILP